MNPDPKTETVLFTAATAGALGLGVAIFRGVIERQHGSIRAWLSGMASAVLVAVLLGWALKASNVDPLWSACVVGLCSYVAPDVLSGLRVLGALISTDPLGGIAKVLNAIRGGKQ